MDRPAAEEVYETKKDSIEITAAFLSEVPRQIGNECFLILEIAVLRSPLLEKPIGMLAGFLIFIAGLAVTGFTNNWIQHRQAVKPYFRKLFYWLFIKTKNYFGQLHGNGS